LLDLVEAGQEAAPLADQLSHAGAVPPQRHSVLHPGVVCEFLSQFVQRSLMTILVLKRARSDAGDPDSPSGEYRLQTRHQISSVDIARRLLQFQSEA
jgi:hypothetical protein